MSSPLSPAHNLRPKAGKYRNQAEPLQQTPQPKQKKTGKAPVIPPPPPPPPPAAATGPPAGDLSEKKTQTGEARAGTPPPPPPPSRKSTATNSPADDDDLTPTGFDSDSNSDSEEAISSAEASTIASADTTMTTPTKTAARATPRISTVVIMSIAILAIFFMAHCFITSSPAQTTIEITSSSLPASPSATRARTYTAKLPCITPRTLVGRAGRVTLEPGGWCSTTSVASG